MIIQIPANQLISIIVQLFRITMSLVPPTCVATVRIHMVPVPWVVVITPSPTAGCMPMVVMVVMFIIPPGVGGCGGVACPRPEVGMWAVQDIAARVPSAATAK